MNNVVVTSVEQAMYERRTVTSSSEIAQLLFDNGLGRATQEELWVLTLGADRSVRTMTRVAMGGYNSVPIATSTIYPPVYLAACDRFVLAHNHPSGKVNPTLDDLELTRTVSEQARILELTFEDHIIVRPDGDWYSMASAGDMGRVELANKLSSARR